MAAGQLFGSAPCVQRRVWEAAVHDMATPAGWVVAARAWGRGGPGRWAKRVGSIEWAGVVAGLAKCFQAKIMDLNRWASDLIFELISRILSLKSKVSNISNWIFN
jgi:hypothetical protein